MKNEEVIREALLNNTIRLIGEGGFERATTKAIAYDGVSIPGVRLNEVHIYRVFGSKEKLYAYMFTSLDVELFAKVGEVFGIFSDPGVTFKEKMESVFRELWHFLLGFENKTRSYVRFFYSNHYKETVLREHRKRLDRVADSFSFAVKEGKSVRALIHALFMVMLDQAIQVYNGDLEDTEETTAYVFRILYQILLPYVKPELKP